MEFGNFPLHVAGGWENVRSLFSFDGCVECEFDRRTKFTVLHSNVQFALFPQAAQRHEPRAARYSCSSISITAALWERKEELLWKTYPKSLISIESNHIGAPIAIRNETKAIPMDTYGAASVESIVAVAVVCQSNGNLNQTCCCRWFDWSGMTLRLAEVIAWVYFLLFILFPFWFYYSFVDTRWYSKSVLFHNITSDCLLEVVKQLQVRTNEIRSLTLL